MKDQKQNAAKDSKHSQVPKARSQNEARTGAPQGTTARTNSPQKNQSPKASR